MSEPKADGGGSREYDVADRGTDYVVTIGDDHRILSVVRLMPLKDCPARGSRPGRGIWHAQSWLQPGPMPREVSRVIAAARAIAAEENRKAAPDV